MEGTPTLDRMIEDVRQAAADAVARIADAVEPDDLQRVGSELLGKRGRLAALKQRLGGLDAGDRPKVGQALNDALAAFSEQFEIRRADLVARHRASQLAGERLDLTELVGRPARGHTHLVTQAQQRLEDVFVGLGFTVSEGPEVDSDWYSFEALNMPPNHPARSEWDTLFVDYGEPGTVVLRPHTSPVQIRVMELQPPPIYTVVPGRVFRRDTADATHMPVFHQIEGLVVDHSITFADLAGTIDAFTKAYFGPGYSSRLRPSYFPFTEPSAEYDIQRPDETWLELGGCGMVHPNVFRSVGIDPEEWSGFAFGFGMDRFALSRHGVDDLREMFSNDIRFLEQF